MYRVGRYRTLLRSPVVVAAPSWTPADLTGLLAWYKADTGVTLSGSDVTAVADQSGNGNDLSANGTVPFNATGFNGHPAFDFAVANGASLSIASVDPGTGNVCSVFIVGQMKTGTASYGGAVCLARIAGSQADFSGAQSCAFLIRDDVNNNIVTYQGGSARLTSAISLATNYRLGVVYDGTNATHYVNGSAGTPTATSFNFADASKLVIGNRAPSDSNAWDGPIAEVIVTLSDITANLGDLDTYFTNKYGL